MPAFKKWDAAPPGTFVKDEFATLTKMENKAYWPRVSAPESHEPGSVLMVALSTANGTFPKCLPRYLYAKYEDLPDGSPCLTLTIDAARYVIKSFNDGDMEVFKSFACHGGKFVKPTMAFSATATDWRRYAGLLTDDSWKTSARTDADYWRVLDIHVRMDLFKNLRTAKETTIPLLPSHLIDVPSTQATFGGNEPPVSHQTAESSGISSTLANSGGNEPSLSQLTSHLSNLSLTQARYTPTCNTFAYNAANMASKQDTSKAPTREDRRRSKPDQMVEDSDSDAPLVTPFKVPKKPSPSSVVISKSSGVSYRP